MNRINVRVPVRICDIGGWTDTWFAGHGLVFNLAVYPGVEVQIHSIKRDADEGITVHLENYDDTYYLEPGHIKYGIHPLIDASIDIMAIPTGLSFTVDIFSHVPPGASTGTSAAVSVALIAGLHRLLGRRCSPRRAAQLAHAVETRNLGLQCGIQDQYCCAYGGINFIKMRRFPQVRVQQISLPVPLHRELENRLVLIYIGAPHRSSEVHRKVIAELGDNAEADPRLETLRTLAIEARGAVRSGNLLLLGEIMNASTQVQGMLHPELVNRKSRQICAIGREFGVLGCKVNGVGGGGGSVTLLTDGDGPKKRELIRSLEQKGFQSLDVSLAPRGLRVWES